MHNAKTAIFYFSGTGNTEIIAKQFAERLRSKGQDVDLFRVEDIFKGTRSVEYEAYDLIGIGHPVLGFGASGFVERFAERVCLIVMEPRHLYSKRHPLHTISITVLRIRCFVLCVGRDIIPFTIRFWRCHVIFILNMMTG